MTHYMGPFNLHRIGTVEGQALVKSESLLGRGTLLSSRCREVTEMLLGHPACHHALCLTVKCNALVAMPTLCVSSFQSSQAAKCELESASCI